MEPARRFGWTIVTAIVVAIAVAWRVREARVGPEATRPTSSAAPTAPPPPLAVPGRTRATTGTPPSADESPAAIEGSSDASTPQPRPVTVTLRLRRADGTSIERATVRSADDAERIYPWDAQTSTVELPEGRQTLEVLGGRFGEWRNSEDFALEVRAGMAPVELTLRPWRMIVGHLRVTAGGPSTRPSARLRSVRSGVDDPDFEDRHEERGVDAGPAGDGWFCFGEDGQLSPGTYELSASPWLYGPAGVPQTVTVRDEAAFVELDLARGDAADGVVVQVLDPDGRPHAPSLVTIDVLDARGGGGSGRATTEPLGDGRYWIPTLLTGYSRADPVEVRIWVRSTAYGERHVDVPVKRGLAPIVVRFDVPAELRIALTNRYEWLRHGGDVEAWIPARDGARHLARAPLSTDGTASLGAFQPGDVQLTVVGRGPAEGLVVGVARPSLRSGENRLSVAAPSLHPLRVHGVEQALLVRATDGSGTRGIVGWWPGGYVPSLPAGVYELQSGDRIATVEIPSVSEVTLTEPPPK